MAGSLDIKDTYATILAVTRNGERTNYEKIAEAHCRKLRGVGRELFDHLSDLLRVCFKRVWLARTLIVVNEKIGAMTGKTYVNFAASAFSAGYEFENARKFETSRPKLVFRWIPYTPEKLEPKETQRLPIRDDEYIGEWESFQIGVT